jgi:hypothetical protein
LAEEEAYQDALVHMKFKMGLIDEQELEKLVNQRKEAKKKA